MQTQTITLKLPKPHEGRTMGGQKRILSEMRRFNVLDCGRRFGKTDLCEIVIHQPILQGYPVGWFAPTYKILDEAWTEITRLYAPIITGANKTEKRIDFITGGILEGWTLDKEGAARGRKYKRIVIDEAARVKNLVDIFNYDLRATLIDYAGDALFPSTPKGLNDFWQLWELAGDDPEWARWQMPTSENPYQALSEIAAMRAAMPERVARQELDAEFLEDGSFFQNVDACCVIERPDKPEQHTGHRIVAGLDWGLSDDFSRLTVYCVPCNRTVDWWGANRMDYSMQREFVKSKMWAWDNPPLLPERNSIGTPNIEMLMQDGLNIAYGPDGAPGFNTTSITKSQLIMALALGMDKKEPRLPKEYAGEMRAYEVEVTTTNPKFSAPDGQHDDRVISSALAWWLAVRGFDPSKMVDSV
jgi:hypothetical protein